MLKRHAQETVDAEPRAPEASIVHFKLVKAMYDTVPPVYRLGAP